MKFLNYVRSNYKRVLSTDAEYVLDSTGTIPKKVVCFVYTDIFTGEVFPFWENNDEHSERHFDYDEVLIVSYNAVAEAGAYLKLLHGKPKNIWDCYVENARLYKPLRMGKGALKLLTTAGHYGIEDKISQTEKDDNINLLIGDIILEVNRERITTIDSFTELINKIKKTGRASLLLKILRDNETLWETIKFKN